jgi:2'-5' RNA ligase
MKGAPKEKVVQFLTHHALFASELFPVADFVLFSSQLSHNGSIYHPERIYPLSSVP